MGILDAGSNTRSPSLLLAPSSLPRLHQSARLFTSANAVKLELHATPSSSLLGLLWKQALLACSGTRRQLRYSPPGTGSRTQRLQRKAVVESAVARLTE